jgi:hypothetical protein
MTDGEGFNRPGERLGIRSSREPHSARRSQSGLSGVDAKLSASILNAG